MRTALFIIWLAAFGMTASGQDSLRAVVETEKAFASLAAEKGMKYAFLEYAAADGILFLPDKIKAVDYWNAREGSAGLLSWAPNHADVSSNGMIGYTTGIWEYRAKGKDDTPSGFGQFLTIWQRMQDGKYRYIVDIGIEHEKPDKYSTELAPPAYPSVPNEKNSSAADTANGFFEAAGRFGLNKAYESYAADEVRAYREGSFPILGKKRLIGYTKSRKSKLIMSRRSTSFGSADIAYISSTYAETKEDGSMEKGNFVQIWKLIDGRWRLVLDIFKPAPAKQG